MAPSMKNQKPNGLILPAAWSNRVPATADALVGFYTRYNVDFHGYIYNAGEYNDLTGTKQPIDGTHTTYNSGNTIIMPVGPYNEVTLQKIGNGTVTVKGSLVNDPNNLVSANLVTSADGLIRIQSLYKFISISASGLDSSSGLYLQIW